MLRAHARCPSHGSASVHREVMQNLVYGIAAFGLLIIVLSLLMIVSPAGWSRGILSFSGKPYFHAAEVVSRLILGGILIIYAGQTTHPMFMAVAGYLFLGAWGNARSGRTLNVRPWFCQDVEGIAPTRTERTVRPLVPIAVWISSLRRRGQTPQRSPRPSASCPCRFRGRGSR